MLGPSFFCSLLFFQFQSRVRYTPHPMTILKRFFHQCLWLSLALMLLGILVLVFLLVKIEQELPDVKHLNEIQLQVPLRIFSKEGELMAEFGLQRRTPLTFDAFPPQLIQAVLATEDARFFEHSGIDIRGLLRAGAQLLITGNKSQGGSTITMQVARNFFLTRKKTYSRKLREILLAIKIEQQLDKEKILELYLNKIYFGNRAYGVGTAAQVYYGKPLQDLNLAQLAMLAGLPKAPSTLNPLYNGAAALKRRNHVLSRMNERHYIDNETLASTSAEPVTASYHGLNITLHAPYVAEMIRAALVQQLGEEKAYTGGYRVYTTINSKAQRAANAALRHNLLAYDRRHGYRGATQNFGSFRQDRIKQWQNLLKQRAVVNGLRPAIITSVAQQEATALLRDGRVIQIPWEGLRWTKPQIRQRYVGHPPETAFDVVKSGDYVYVEPLDTAYWQLSQIPEVEGALVALDPHNGQIMSLVGGFDFVRSKFNRATQAKRQVGSAFKPFVYAAALAKGLTPATIINDAPIVMADPTEEQEEWRPQNSNRQFYGPIRLRTGLVKSRNTVSIRILEAIGIDYTLNYIKQLGLQVDKLPNTLSLALGAGEMTPLEVTAGYATFANGGYRITPYLIDRIEEGDKGIFYQYEPPTVPLEGEASEVDGKTKRAPRVMAPQEAYLMTNMMQDVIQSGTGRGAKVLGRHDLAAKTGTTNNQQDAWFAGFNADLVTTVWVGFDQPRSLHEYAAQVAIPLWVDFMGKTLKDQPERSLPEPPHMVTLRIDPETGAPAPFGKENAIFETFREQYAPMAKDSPSTALAQQAVDDDVWDNTQSDDTAAAPMEAPLMAGSETSSPTEHFTNHTNNDMAWEEAAQLF